MPLTRRLASIRRAPACCLAALLLFAAPPAATAGPRSPSEATAGLFIGDLPSPDALRAENGRLAEESAELDRLLAEAAPADGAAADAPAADPSSPLAVENDALRKANDELAAQADLLRATVAARDAAASGVADPADPRDVAGLLAEGRRLRGEVDGKASALALAEGRQAPKRGALPDVDFATLLGNCSTGGVSPAEMSRRVRESGELVGEIAPGDVPDPADYADQPTALRSITAAREETDKGSRLLVYRYDFKAVEPTGAADAVQALRVRRRRDGPVGLRRRAVAGGVRGGGVTSGDDPHRPAVARGRS